jgi:hypothetical protein
MTINMLMARETQMIMTITHGQLCLQRKNKQTNKSVQRFQVSSIHFAFCRAVRRGRAATNQTIPVSGDRDELPAADGP